jgi:hypothetical protein
VEKVNLEENMFFGSEEDGMVLDRDAVAVFGISDVEP